MNRSPVDVARDMLTLYGDLEDKTRREDIQLKLRHLLETMLHMAPELLQSRAPWDKICAIISYDCDNYDDYDAVIALLRGNYEDKSLQTKSLLSRAA